jgi:hypothetical protein
MRSILYLLIILIGALIFHNTFLVEGLTGEIPADQSACDDIIYKNAAAVKAQNDSIKTLGSILNSQISMLQGEMTNFQSQISKNTKDLKAKTAVSAQGGHDVKGAVEAQRGQIQAMSGKL